MKVDVDLLNEKMDRIEAGSYNISPDSKLNVDYLNLLNDADKDLTLINFTDSTDLANNVDYTGENPVAYSPIYKYDVGYDKTNGIFSFLRGSGSSSGDYNPTVLAPATMSLAGAYWGTNHWSSLRQQITPSWLFLCNVVFFVSLTIFYWLIEVAGYKKVFSFLAYAGTASLTCYLIFYLCHCIQTLIGLFYPKVLYSGYFSLGRAFLFSMIVLLIACSLSKLKVKIKI